MFKLLGIVPLLDLERFEVLNSFTYYQGPPVHHTMDRLDITTWTVWTSRHGPLGHHTMDRPDSTPWTIWTSHYGPSGHHTTDRVEERSVERGNVRRSSVKEGEKAIVKQTDVATVSVLNDSGEKFR